MLLSKDMQDTFNEEGQLKVFSLRGQGKQTSGYIAVHVSVALHGVRWNVDIRGYVRVWKHTGGIALLQPKAAPN